MIQETITHHCTNCNSQNIIRNGRTPHGKQKYKCKNCGRYATLEPTTKYTPEQREYILAAYQERSSMRGIQRVHGVSRNTLKVWLKKRQPVAS
jgi:transposase-like protein